MLKRYVTSLIILIMMICFLTGCLPSKLSIDKIENITVVGIDEEDGKVTLTIILQMVKPVAKEDSGEKQKVAIYTAEGETVYESVRNFRAYTDKDIFWGHINYIILGEETAEKGIGKYLDFFARDYDMKLTAKLVISQESTASEFIKNTNLPGTSLKDKLDSLFKNSEFLSQSKEVSVIDYMYMINCPLMDLYLPCVQMVDYKEKDEEEMDKKDVQLNGYAIFDDDKLVGIVKDKMARGINWITNEISSGIIVTEDPKGQKISLEIISAKCKIEPDFSEDIPSAMIKVEFTTNIGEYQGTDDIFHEEIIEFIVDEQDKIIKKEIEKIITYLQQKKRDIVGIGNETYHKFPIKFKKIEQRWKDIFNVMDISVKVNSRINRTYLIIQPIGNKGEDK